MIITRSDLGARRLEDGRIELQLPAGDVDGGDVQFKSDVQPIAERALGLVSADLLFIEKGEGASFEHMVLVEVDGTVDLENLKVDSSVFVSEWALQPCTFDAFMMHSIG